MKKIKMKKIRSSKIFILFGLIFTMFTACIFCFKSYAYTPNNEGDLINNNIFPCDNIVANEGIVNGQFVGLYGEHYYESTNNIWKFVYTADSRDLVNNRLTVVFETPHISFSGDNYIFQYFYNDLDNFSIGFKAYSSSTYSYPTTSDDYYVYNDMEIYYSNYFSYNGNIDSMQFICYHSLTPGETYTWWFYLNIVPISSIFNDYSFNPKNIDDIFESHKDLVDLNNQLNSYISQNNTLQSQVNNLQNQVNQLTNSNHVLLQQLANANSDYNLNNLVWSIGGTPFETFKTIWNFEFFGVNISNLVFGLLTGLIIIWIIKKFFF